MAHSSPSKDTTENLNITSVHIPLARTWPMIIFSCKEGWDMYSVEASITLGEGGRERRGGGKEEEENNSSNKHWEEQ